MSFIQKIADSAKQLSIRARDFGGMAGDKAKDLTKKSSDLLELTRMKHELRKMEKEMENNLAGIGALYYQQQSGKDNVEEEMQRLLATTRELEQEMKELEAEIAAMQPEQPFCPDCRKELPAGGNFCSYCGKQISSKQTQ
ncbi:zinc ribbon domain-containing protein [Desulfoscipio geothermicus]|uniref:Zinc-ribbon domain-containing protein n=1 Tax=Desulfoscipio geothermicus DSM 3669 TaxID=1121426 RepID=A0A1I6E5D0_9FIRM|nr:zinc ribbon domain-containing protein [Desulfoscipio geothermicus]SFR12935.1 hypothetical protein SAMN05660706_12638 [Desulfoscipio geothermicus DSM 3669]